MTPQVGTAAQAPAEDPAVTIDVLLERPWFGPDSPLAIDVVVRNTADVPAHDLRVSVAFYPRVRSRTELERVFDGRLPRTPLETFTFRLEPMAPGTVQTVRVAEPLESLDAFEGAPDGLYPMSATVRRSTEQPTDEAIAALALLNERPLTPLRVLPVLELAPPPFGDPDGSLTAGGAMRLDRLIKTLEGLPVPGVVAGVGLRPTLVEELDHLGDTPQAEQAGVLMSVIRRVAEGSELLAVPYEHTYLPHLASSDQLAGQLRVGADTIASYLNERLVPVTAPPTLALDAPSIDALAAAGIRTALTNGELLSDGPLTPADAVRTGDVTLIPTDGVLGSAMTRARDHLDIVRAAAETAMVYFESPGRERTLAAVLGWNAINPAGVLTVMRDAPWIDLVAPSAVTAIDPRPSTIRFPSVSDPPRSYRDAVRGAEEALETLDAVTYDDNAVRRRLATAVGVARSTAFWDGRWIQGRRFALAIARTVDEESRQLSVETAPVTFTSRRGDVPITVVNAAAYPMRLRVDIESPKLSFPEGSSRVIDPLNPPGETITFPALADATGTFPLTIRLSSEDGRTVLLEEELLVRSTAANVFALGLTVGAAAFLLTWYGRHMFQFRAGKRRRSR